MNSNALFDPTGEKLSIYTKNIEAQGGNITINGDGDVIIQGGLNINGQLFTNLGGIVPTFNADDGSLVSLAPEVDNLQYQITTAPTPVIYDFSIFPPVARRSFKISASFSFVLSGPLANKFVVPFEFDLTNYIDNETGRLLPLKVASHSTSIQNISLQASPSLENQSGKAVNVSLTPPLSLTSNTIFIAFQTGAPSGFVGSNEYYGTIDFTLMADTPPL